MICVRHRLGGEEINGVGQTVWLVLAENSGNLRDPAALPGWPQLSANTFARCGQRTGMTKQNGPPRMGCRQTPEAEMIEEDVLTGNLVPRFARLPPVAVHASQ